MYNLSVNDSTLKYFVKTLFAPEWLHIRDSQQTLRGLQVHSELSLSTNRKLCLTSKSNVLEGTSQPRVGLIIEWPLNGKFNGHRDVILTSRLVVINLTLMVVVKKYVYLNHVIGNISLSFIGIQSSHLK